MTLLDTSSRPRNPSFAALWQAHAPGVRRHLARFGVAPADLDDLVQEVFLLAHAKRDHLAAVRQVELWLREVSRRVAAGHRRRAHRRHEVAFSEPPELPTDAPPLGSELERNQDEDRLHRALDQLDERSRDLVALHQLGDLPLVEVATLVAADRKTVRKRLTTALRRLTLLLGSNDEAQSRAATAVEAGSTARGQPSASAAPFRVLTRHPTVGIGLLGSTVIAVWKGQPTVTSLELLDRQFQKVREGGETDFVYLAVVEASTRPPGYEARQKIVAMIKDHTHDISVHAHALEGGAAWIARPIMTALALLARPPYPMHFFNGAASAARFLSENEAAHSRATYSGILSAITLLREP